MSSSRRVLFPFLFLVCWTAVAAQRAEPDLDVRISAIVESGYLSSSGWLIDTRPSCEQMAEETLWLGEYGRLTACEWEISALHGGQDENHRRAFYLFEGTVGYGYDFTFSDSLDVVNEVGIVWDSPWGYKHYSQEEVGWWFRQSVENPILVPYIEAIGLFTPDRWLRIAFGIRRGFRWGDFTLTPSFETVWGDADRFYVCYDDVPSHRFLGGAFMTVMPGIRLDWAFAKGWNVWFRFREFITVDPQARQWVNNQSEYYIQNEAEIFTLGVSYAF